MKEFNNQFATQKLRQEVSTTSTSASFTPGVGEQFTTNKKKKQKTEQKDVEPKLAAGKAKIYAKDKWGWEEAPSIPNRPSKGGFIYKQLFEELKKTVDEYNNIDDNINPFEPGDRIKVTYGNEFYGQTGTVEDITKSYVIVSIDDDPEDGEYSMHYSDVEIIEDQEEDYDDELNESYSKFKTETKTRDKSDQFHQAVRQVKKKVQEINKLFEYVSRLKTELSEGQDGLKYKIHTERALAKIKEMVSELNTNIKRFK